MWKLSFPYLSESKIGFVVFHDYFWAYHVLLWWHTYFHSSTYTTLHVFYLYAILIPFWSTTLAHAFPCTGWTNVLISLKPCAASYRNEPLRPALQWHLPWWHVPAWWHSFSIVQALGIFYMLPTHTVVQWNLYGNSMYRYANTWVDFDREAIWKLDVLLEVPVARSMFAFWATSPFAHSHLVPCLFSLRMFRDYYIFAFKLKLITTIVLAPALTGFKLTAFSPKPFRTSTRTSIVL